jgi:pimeloyl-ACP methyl ester carboxylesterase
MPTSTVTANGLCFHVETGGPPDGPLALLLHGFPDTASSWRPLAAHLAAAGYAVACPTLRGYGPTGPAPDGRYDTETLGADARALRRALAPGRPAVLIGHDWGAGATYEAIIAEPDAFACAVAMSVPLLAAGGLDLSTFGQMRRSFYSFLLQLPDAVEVLRRDDLRLLDELWHDWSPGLDAPDAIAAAKAALADAGCLEAAVAYYRQNPSVLVPAAAVAGRLAAAHAITTPLLYLHGADDGCMGLDVLERARTTFPPTTPIEVLPNAGHFLQLEQPDAVADLVLPFLRRHAAAAARPNP